MLLLSGEHNMLQDASTTSLYSPSSRFFCQHYVLLPSHQVGLTRTGVLTALKTGITIVYSCSMPSRRFGPGRRGFEPLERPAALLHRPHGIREKRPNS